MRIGVFTYGIDGERMTGIARYTVELTRAMKRIAPSLDIVLLNPNNGSKHPLYDEFPTYPLPRSRLLPAAVTLGNLSLHRAALDLELDVLHDPCDIAPFLAPAKRRYVRVTTIHDAIPGLYPDTQPWLTRTVFSTLIPAAGRTADTVLTVSEASKADLTKHYGLPAEKIRVTPNGMRPTARLGESILMEALRRVGVQKPYILYVGALDPRKNMLRVLEAFARVHSRVSDAQLATVGPPSWGANDVLRQVLDRAEADVGVVFTGFVSDKDLQALYQGTVALVFPSLYEGFGLPALEAMSHSAAVITSSTSALPEAVGEAGLLVEPTSVKAIAEAMRRMLTDASLREDLRSKGRLRSRAFTWDATARRTLDVFHSALSGATA